MATSQTFIEIPSVKIFLVNIIYHHIFKIIQDEIFENYVFRKFRFPYFDEAVWWQHACLSVWYCHVLYLYALITAINHS